MKTEEEIVQQMVEEMPFHMDKSCKPYIYEAMEIYAEQFKPKWISIADDKKPTILESVLACLTNDMVVQVSYVGYNSFSIILGGIREIPENNPITHWMKLPNAPKQ